ncbi:hypothetical protein G5I_14614 [Acromyrmex echinatior]|uniref:Uncharacterized protein n=1 Tax=Acromyrmex echinatior TaxID=103372 RepID=F4X8D5_ACREC|nr:hypothetical protein G5I_14614 [Acromyrmex echinatior]
MGVGRGRERPGTLAYMTRKGQEEGERVLLSFLILVLSQSSPSTKFVLCRPPSGLVTFRIYGPEAGSTTNPSAAIRSTYEEFIRAEASRTRRGNRDETTWWENGVLANVNARLYTPLNVNQQFSLHDCGFSFIHVTRFIGDVVGNTVDIELEMQQRYPTTACLFKSLTYKRYSAGKERDASLSGRAAVLSGMSKDVQAEARKQRAKLDGSNGNEKVMFRPASFLERGPVSSFPAHLRSTQQGRFKNNRGVWRKHEEKWEMGNARVQCRQ